MPDDPQVKVVLTAEDQGVAAALRQLGEQLKSVNSQQGQLASSSERAAKQMTANFGGVGKAVAQMGDAIKLRLGNIPVLGGVGGSALRAYLPVGRDLEETFGGLEETLGGAGAVLGGFAAALAGLGAIATEITFKMTSLAQSISNTAAATGLSATQVQEFTELAREMDLDAGSLTQAFVLVNRQIGEYITTGKAAGSGTELFGRVMTQLGVSLKTATGEARPAADVLSDFYSALQRIPDAATRTVLMDEALGRGAKIIAPLFAEATREGVSFHDLLQKIDASGPVLTDAQLANLLEAKSKWDDLTRSVRGYAQALEVTVAFATTHVKDALKAYVSAGGGSNGIAAIYGESFIPPAGAKSAGTGHGGSSAAVLEVSQLNAQLDHRLQLLRAGGEAQLQLLTAETGYKNAVAQGNRTLADAYQLQITELRQIIALENERKTKKPFGQEAQARAQRVAYEQYQHRIEQAKSATRDLAGVTNDLNRAESEAARGGLAAQTKGIAEDARLAAELTQRLREMQDRGFALDEQLGGKATGPKGYETSRLRAQIQRDESDQTKADLLGQKELAQALAGVIDKEKQLLSIDEQVINKKQILAGVSKGLTQDFDLLFQSIGRGAGGVKQAFGQMELAVIQSLENMAAKMVANLALSLAIGDLQRISDAKQSATGAFNAAIHALPWPINIPVAFASAAAAFSGAMAFREGGLVRGPGGPTGDRVPAMLSNGEFVLRASAVQSIGLHGLQALNAGDIRPAGHTEIHVHPEINLFHNGKDTREVMERELAPMIEGMFRRGALNFKP